MLALYIFILWFFKEKQTNQIIDTSSKEYYNQTDDIIPPIREMRHHERQQSKLYDKIYCTREQKATRVLPVRTSTESIPIREEIIRNHLANKSDTERQIEESYTFLRLSQSEHRRHEEPSLNKRSRKADHHKADGTTDVLREISCWQFHSTFLLLQSGEQFLHSGIKSVDVTPSGSSHPRLTTTPALDILGSRFDHQTGVFASLDKRL